MIFVALWFRIATMRLALVQQHATPDKQHNIARGLHAFETAARAGAELVAFAELAFEPFYPQTPAGPSSRAAAEPVPGPLTDAFAARARELHAVAVLNLFERDGDRTFDCSPVIDADGTLVGRTRMVHITEYACFHEQGYYTPGGRIVARAAQGADAILSADLDLTQNAASHARRLFLQHRRPELYAGWLSR